MLVSRPPTIQAPVPEGNGKNTRQQLPAPRDRDVTLTQSRKSRIQHRDGVVAQLGERVVRNDEVVGSIPISSTIWYLISVHR